MEHERTDEVITISVDDFIEYHQLLKARDILANTIKKNKSVSLEFLLMVLGGYDCFKLLEEMERCGDVESDTN